MTRRRPSPMAHGMPRLNQLGWVARLFAPDHQLRSIGFLRRAALQADPLGEPLKFIEQAGRVGRDGR